MLIQLNSFLLRKNHLFASWTKTALIYHELAQNDGKYQKINKHQQLFKWANQPTREFLQFWAIAQGSFIWRSPSPKGRRWPVEWPSRNEWPETWCLAHAPHIQLVVKTLRQLKNAGPNGEQNLGVFGWSGERSQAFVFFYKTHALATRFEGNFEAMNQQNVLRSHGWYIMAPQSCHVQCYVWKMRQQNHQSH